METDLVIEQIRNEYVKLTGNYLHSSYIQFLICIVLVDGWETVLQKIEEEPFDIEQSDIINGIFRSKVTSEIWYSVTLKLFQKITKVPDSSSSRWEEFDHLFDAEDSTGQKFDYKAMVYLATYSLDTRKERINYMLKKYQPSGDTFNAILRYNKENKEKPDLDILCFLFSILFRAKSISDF